MTQALRALKRQVSDAVFDRLQADRRRAARGRTGEGDRGTTPGPPRPDCTPQTGS